MLPVSGSAGVRLLPSASRRRDPLSGRIRRPSRGTYDGATGTVALPETRDGAQRGATVPHIFCQLGPPPGDAFLTFW